MQCTVISKFFETIYTLLDVEKTPKDYGAEVKLFHSEVNLLEAVYRYPDTNAIELSKILAISRGAVTQLANKLEEKGLILRYTREGNKKEKYFKLTVLGERLRQGHETYHAQANQQICAYLQSLTACESKVIIDFLDQLKALPISEFECSGACLLSMEMNDSIEINKRKES